MVELNGRRVLKHVPPPGIALVVSSSVSGIVEFRERRYDPFSHVGELVVDESSIESGDEGTCEGRERVEERGKEGKREGGDASVPISSVQISKSPALQSSKKA